MAYRSLTEQEAVEYVKRLPGLFSEKAVLSSREIGDGNLNLVFDIVEEETGKRVIVKQAVPYARVVGESWPLSVDRSRIESEALRLQRKYVPELVPEVYHYDPELALTVMEHVGVDRIIMRKGLIEGNRYPLFAKQIGRFLAHTLFYTSDLGAHPYEKKALVGKFINPELCKITEDLVFTDPYEDASTNNFNPLIRREVEAIWKNKPLKLEIAKLKFEFLTRAEALLHGDLHTGSIFISPTDLKVIDPEFAYYGPIGFDVGAVIANLLLNFAGQHGLQPDPEKRESYRAFLLETVENVWNEFVSQFVSLWHKHAKERSAFTEGYWESYVHRLIQDTAGFAGCKILRRVIGLAGVADLNQIEDQRTRAEAERLALAIGEALILERGNVHVSTDITDLVRTVTARYYKEATAV